jgi:hypothetical protein
MWGGHRKDRKKKDRKAYFFLEKSDKLYEIVYKSGIK